MQAASPTHEEEGPWADCVSVFYILSIIYSVSLSVLVCSTFCTSALHESAAWGMRWDRGVVFYPRIRTINANVSPLTQVGL